MTRNFRYFDRRTAALGRSFLEHAADGNLASVSWIDPNFVDFDLLGPAGSNDDHPSSDVKAGQKLVLALYNALASSPRWSKTLLVVTYDEHGGFFDHVAPPAAIDDKAAFRSYGPRVPALVVSPWIPRGTVSSELYDHTSIIKTILLRFCRKPDGSIPNMGARVAHGQPPRRAADARAGAAEAEGSRAQTPDQADHAMAERRARGEAGEAGGWAPAARGRAERAAGGLSTRQGQGSTGRVCRQACLRPLRLADLPPTRRPPYVSVRSAAPASPRAPRSG